MMTDELAEVKLELESLKEKYKNKSEVVRKANKKIAYLEERCQWHRARRHQDFSHYHCLTQLTAHLEKFVYDIKYKYDGKIHVETKVSAYGTRWLKDGLICHLAKDKDLTIEAYEIEIIDVKKVW